MRILCAALCTAVILQGCSSPLVAPQAPTFQKKVTNAEHWQLMANASVTRVTDAARNVPELDPRMHLLAADGSPTPSLVGRRYYVHGPATDMPFSITYKKMMEESLLESGLIVSKRPSGSLVVNFQVETYAYGPRHNRTPFSYATLWGALTAIGIGLDAAAPISAGAGAGLAVGASLVIDALVAMGDITNAEVLVTTSIVDHTTVIYQETETFYVNPADLPLYWSRFPPARPVETGPVEPELLPVKLVSVTAN